ncbi:GxxExxY protein, partial [candidate division KSB1 bacterium]|nr:GxxExxY protein [candidate division KSB1 bacterium]
MTEAIIGSAYEVHNILGYGFLEKVYQKALQVELLRRGHSAEISPTRYKALLCNAIRSETPVSQGWEEAEFFDTSKAFPSRS